MRRASSMSRDQMLAFRPYCVSLARSIASWFEAKG